LVDYGFATTSQTGELMMEEKKERRILNMDKMCLLLDGSNDN
jgi:hypothetical protein